MANGKEMFSFHFRNLPVDTAGLPALLMERGLYDGSQFVNVPEASTPEQAAAFAVTGTCSQGKLVPDFAKALARAKMVQDGIACGAFGWNADNCIAEWRVNSFFDAAAGDAAMGEVLSIAYVNGTGLFLSDQGGRDTDVTKTGYAPFLFALWGFFCEKCEGFRDAFALYCQAASDPNTFTQAQMAACRMAAAAQEAFQKDIISAALPTNANMRRLTAPQRASQRFAPEQQVGNFVNFQTRGTAAGWKKIRSVKSFTGMFANQNRTLTEEEKAMVPDISSGYVLPPEIVTACQMVAQTRDGVRPMNNIMLRGDPSVGKTAGARAMAAGLNLPYTFVTCNAGTELYNLIGDMMPVNAGSENDIPTELFADMPSATDISMDPAAAYIIERIKGMTGCGETIHENKYP